jgi:hypothetical protein
MTCQVRHEQAHDEHERAAKIRSVRAQAQGSGLRAQGRSKANNRKCVSIQHVTQTL